MKKILQRARAQTPPFFTRLRNIGLVAAGLATALLSAPVALPAMVSTLAGYLLAAGSMAATISQLTVNEEAPIPPVGEASKGGEHGNAQQP
ncbi:MAG: hypothetical protein V4450_00785 [Bacteroidota bacterium]